MSKDEQNKQAQTAKNSEASVTDNPWERLRAFTDARIGLGRAGISIPTKHSLAFQLAHAKAQDAVHTPLSFENISTDLNALKEVSDFGTLALHSQAKNRQEYLQRPDFGRLLNEPSCELLNQDQGNKNIDYDLAIVVVDGLSAFAIEQNAAPFLAELLPRLGAREAPSESWNIAPICIVEQGRVAIGDHIGTLLNAKSVLVLIGERPGLSSPDSMGLYLTWSPKLNLTDASRNCISNIRQAGMGYSEAAQKATYLLNEARIKKLSGVQLKDRSEDESFLEAETKKPA